MVSKHLKMVDVLSWTGSHIFGEIRLKNLMLSVKLIRTRERT